MIKDDLDNAIKTAGIERQLGEVIGTLKATVQGLETLRLSVERLTERAAFKGDLDSMRVEILSQITKMRVELENEIAGEKKKMDAMRLWIATATGVGIAVGFILKFIDFGFRISIGG
jgi:hypothetical protein